MLEPDLVEGDLAALVGAMSGSGTGFTKLRFVVAKNEAPYKVEDGYKNQEVELFGNTATYVGIVNTASVGLRDFIVSDSFAPCVPVIALERNACSLAHCNGTGGIHRYSASWDREDASIVVIGKQRETWQRRVADEILKILKADRFRWVSLCEVPTSGLIGVIIRYDTILIYNQG